jgi:hypothetical protein
VLRAFLETIFDLEETITMSTIRIVERKSYFLEAGGELLNPWQPADLAKIETRLSAPEAIRGLTINGKAGAVIDLLKAMPLKQQVAVLSAPEAILFLAGYGEAGAVIDLLKAMPLKQQAAVLSAPGAVRSLAHYGNKADAVIDLLKAMPLKQQAAVLSAPDAVEGLADNGKAGAVADIRRSLARQVPGSARSRAARFPGNHL